MPPNRIGTNLFARTIYEWRNQYEVAGRKQDRDSENRARIVFNDPGRESLRPNANVTNLPRFSRCAFLSVAWRFSCAREKEQPRSAAQKFKSFPKESD